MVTIEEVKTKKQLKNFVRFTLELYKNCPYYVPFIVQEEMILLNKKKNFNLEENEIKAFIAYKDGKIAGKIAGIISHPYNKKTGRKALRFSRFDCIDDDEVASALFDALKLYAKESGLNEIHGPLGFNDLEREGLLIDGFDIRATYVTAYNFPYYQKLIENRGFLKEADWVEYSIEIPEKKNERFAKIAELVKRKYNYTDIMDTMKVNEVIKKHGKDIFETINEAFEPLHGVTHISDKVRDNILSTFSLVLNSRYASVITNSDNEVVGMSIVFPSMAKALIKSRGSLFPLGIFRLLKSVKHPKEVELGLIAVRPKYQGKGINAIMINKILGNLIDDGFKEVESNPELELNEKVQSQWKELNAKIIKRRRCFLKTL